MNIDQAVTLTQDRLAEEGGTMGELLGHFRNRVSPVLIGDRQWERILECAGNLPVTMGALPFGFELPLHDSRAGCGPGRFPGERHQACDVLSGARAKRREG